MKFISNTAHYKEVLSRVPKVKHNLWIGTADIKDLYVEVADEVVVAKFANTTQHGAIEGNILSEIATIKHKI